MFEHYLSVMEHGITDIDIEIDTTPPAKRAQDPAGTVPDELASPHGDDRQPAGLVTVTVTFAVRTDERAPVTIYSDGSVGSAMGGLGLRDDEWRAYCLAAIRLFEQVVRSHPDRYAANGLTFDDDAGEMCLDNTTDRTEIFTRADIETA